MTNQSNLIVEAKELFYLGQLPAAIRLADSAISSPGLVPFAIKLHHRYLQDNKNAFNWLERLKGRAFLDALAITSLRTPDLVDSLLLVQEQEMLTALNWASSQTEVVELSERLYALWEQMKQEAIATEYVSLRLGEPMRWETLQSLLQFETVSIDL